MHGEEEGGLNTVIPFSIGRLESAQLEKTGTGIDQEAGFGRQDGGCRRQETDRAANARAIRPSDSRILTPDNWLPPPDSFPSEAFVVG